MSFLYQKKSVNQQIYGFDYLRIICAICVVAIHSFDTNTSLSNFIGYFKFPVPVFLMMSFFLLFRKVYHGNNDISFYLKQRCKRLLPCFFLWTIIYLFIRIIAQSNLSLSWDAIAGYLFFGSAAVQLYYLPLTIYYCIILLPFITICKRQKALYSTLALSLILFLAIAIDRFFSISSYKNLLNNDLRIFLQYATSYLIYSIFGIYFAFLMTYNRSEKIQIKRIKFLSLTIFAVIMVLAFWSHDLFQYLPNFINLSIFALFYYIPLPYNQVVSYLGKISLGIYLSHHLFIESFQVIEQSLGYNLENFYLTIINFLLGTILSVVFSMVLYGIKKIQFMVS